MTNPAEHASEEADSAPVPAGRDRIVVQWAQRHGVEVAQRLADAEDFADEVRRRLRPANTTDTYAKAWRVWTRFCATQGFPELEPTRGVLTAFVVWLLDRGQVNGNGYAVSSASTILAGTVVELRRHGAEVNRDDQAQARATLDAAIALGELLAALPDERREAFVLTQLVGLPYAETAALSDCPVGTVRSRVARARASLLRALNEAERTEPPGATA
ncbi:sigma factor-like helix-turn-helix DNA-binding protein [Streptomyces sp. H62]